MKDMPEDELEERLLELIDACGDYSCVARRLYDLTMESRGKAISILKPEKASENSEQAKGDVATVH